MTFEAGQIDVHLVPSVWHRLLLVAVHGLAIVALLLAQLETWLLVAMILAVLASFTYSFLRFGQLRAPDSVVHLSYGGDAWQILLRSGRMLQVSPESTIVVLGWLVVINFRDEARKHFPVALLPDSTGADEFRRLKVLLKHGISRTGEE